MPLTIKVDGTDSQAGIGSGSLTRVRSNRSPPSSASTVDAVAGRELALEQAERQRVDQLLRDHALERAAP